MLMLPDDTELFLLNLFESLFIESGNVLLVLIFNFLDKLLNEERDESLECTGEVFR